MPDLLNQTALVTGASRGITSPIDFAELDLHNSNEADSVVAEIEAGGGKATGIQGDLASPDGATAIAGRVRAIVGNRLDILVANAGVSKAARLADYTLEDFDNLFATNVRGPFFLVQQLVPLLGEGSNIIFTKTEAGRDGSPGRAFRWTAVRSCNRR
jgi:3-oxoacyl-[acyl-carrier protein] reductase